MQSSTKNIFISTIIMLFFSTVLYASAGLQSELDQALKLPKKDAAFRVYQLTIRHLINAPLDSVAHNKNLIITALSQNDLPNQKAMIYEVEAISSKRLLKLNDAKKFAQRGINEVGISENQLIRLLSLLAYIETDLENYLAAIENYQVIEKLLQRTNEPRKLIVSYIGLGDLYNKSGLYKEALNTFTKAFNMAQQEKIKVPMILYENMAIVYFNLKRSDSLQYYSDKILKAKVPLDDSIAFHRLTYMKLILAKDSRAINEIKKVINDPKDGDPLLTTLNLAKAYIEFNQIENAKSFILETLAKGDLKNVTFLSSQLYKLLSDIYLKKGEFKVALLYYKKSVEQLTLNAEKQSKSDNILAVLKYYEIKTKYATIENDLVVRKNYLLLLTIIAVMIILTLFFLYRTVWIKKRFNRLQYDRLNNELSFINSHEVRKHLSNILGIIEVIKISDDKHKAYEELETALLHSAENLDISIKNISKKLASQKD